MVGLRSVLRGSAARYAQALLMRPKVLSGMVGGSLLHVGPHAATPGERRLKARADDDFRHGLQAESVLEIRFLAERGESRFLPKRGKAEKAGEG